MEAVMGIISGLAQQAGGLISQATQIAQGLMSALPL